MALPEKLGIGAIRMGYLKDFTCRFCREHYDAKVNVFYFDMDEFNIIVCSSCFTGLYEISPKLDWVRTARKFEDVIRKKNYEEVDNNTENTPSSVVYLPDNLRKLMEDLDRLRAESNKPKGSKLGIHDGNGTV